MKKTPPLQGSGLGGALAKHGIQEGSTEDQILNKDPQGIKPWHSKLLPLYTFWAYLLKMHTQMSGKQNTRDFRLSPARSEGL